MHVHSLQVVPERGLLAVLDGRGCVLREIGEPGDASGPVGQGGVKLEAKVLGTGRGGIPIRIGRVHVH